jgi:beta-galactosidase
MAEPVMPFGAAYYPEHRDPARWEYDLDLMKAASVNALRVGEFAWTRFEPAAGHYDFAWMDRFAGLALKREIRLLLCPPFRTAPAWLVEQEPDIKLETETGIRLEFGTRYSFCINHPGYRKAGIALADAMARHYGPSPTVLGWHLDNEFGDEPFCHCPRCRSLFQDWLRKKYSSIDTLNREWGNVFWSLEYNRFEQIPTPRLSKTMHSPALNINWRRFRSDCTSGLIGQLAGTLRARGAAQPVTTNFQTWNHATDYYEAAQHLDVCGTNYYPPYGLAWPAEHGLANVRSYKKKNFGLYELRCGAHALTGAGGNTPAPGEVMRLTLHTVGHGADAIYYFRWRQCPFGAEQNHGSITGFDGRPKRVYAEIAETGRRLKRIWPQLEGTTVKSGIATLFDIPTTWTEETGWAFQGDRNLYMQHYTRIRRAIRKRHFNCDAVGRDGDFGAYAVLVVPMLSPVDDALADKLVRYVRNGGTLVWHPMSGCKNMEATLYTERLHPALGALFGLDVSEFATSDAKDPVSFTYKGETYKGGYFYDLPVLNGATALGAYSGTWFAGTPALTERREGGGRALYIGTFADETFYPDFLAAVCAEAGVKPVLDAPVNENLELVERSAPDGRRFIFLLSYSGKDQTLQLPKPMQDIWNEETVSARCIVPPCGVRILKAT